MEPANKSSVTALDPTDIEFLPDADEIERRPLPPYARITVHALAAMLVCFLGWASIAEIDEVVKAQGRLTTPLSNIVVQPIETSIIRSIDVRIGQVVKKGERLATLDPTDADADQAQLRLKFDSLDTQVKRLEAELTGRGTPAETGKVSADTQLQDKLAGERRANFAAQMARLDENIAKTRASLDTNVRDQQVLGDRTRSLREVETMQERLVDQKFGAKVNLLDARNKRMEVERDYTLAKNQEPEIRRTLAGLEAEKRAFVNGWRQKIMEDLLNLTRERDATAEQIKKGTLRRDKVILTAPADAMVQDIAKLSQGSVAQAAEKMFTLVPLGTALDAEVQIDSLDVGHVKPGDVAHIKLDAFPFQKHGTLEAKVRTLSEDAFKRDTANAESGTDAYYVSRIDLGGGKLKNMDPHARLLPGMTLTAEIVVGKRTVLSYLLWPLTKGLDEAIREP
ncbi:HlyD family type I secretion periplasmic adaptor subunit [Massilia sp. NEAU-DD11]|uniref:Membrane fusion protein (MFP) family protein n=1 Tax=Massilia cellulosiltytica TaxID=2683234 RepID=A0A7X3FUS7_9BURK|nr:HlyD family type I secretion periplasmic adaptor subunit [Telluria cellulosilytica]MVW58371.1 HlyD family type I secretion periplasmic adaptor subunit [Telluria cellulosilytica]